eukprot:jgi/Orpsp1_1/1188679/evm.model.d7180000066463.1
MKFLGSFIILAVLNLVAVLAGPPPTIYVKEGDFNYYIPGGTNFAIADTPLNLNAKTVTVKPYVTYNGRRYYTKYFSGYFKNSVAERIIFPSSFSEEIFMSGFETAKKLKVIQVDTPKARIHKSYADKVSRSVLIEGKGVEGMMLAFAKDMLDEYGYQYGLEKYDASKIFERKCFLYHVDKFVHKNFKYVAQNGNNYENGVHSLIYMKGNSLGLARVTRVIATAAGYDKNVIRVGGDDQMFGWNFVEFEREWYIMDYPFTTYAPLDRDQCHPSFKTSSELIQKLNSYYGKGVKMNADSFVVHHGMFGYNGEVGYPKKENFKNWLKIHNLGTLM